MNDLTSNDKKLSVRTELEKVGGNWDFLFSKYDEEIKKIQSEIDKLLEASKSFKNDGNVLEAVSKELAEKTASLTEIKASRKDLVDYLIRKQKRVKNLYDRVEKETSLFNQAKSKLKLEIDDLNLELERLKKNYDNMISFPIVQETIQQEMEKILKIVNEKKQKLENKYRKELLSEVLLRRVVNREKLKEGDFLSVNGYKLKKTNEYGFVFVDSDGKEISNVEDLGLNINRHGYYHVNKINDYLIDIVTNGDHYVYDFRKMDFLGRENKNMYIMQSGGDKYIALKDLGNSLFDNEYYIFDLETGEKLFDNPIVGQCEGIKQIGGKELIHTRGSGHIIYFYDKNSGEKVGSKEGYVGYEVIPDLTKLKNLGNSKEEFIKKIFDVEGVFVITTFEDNSISVLDSETLDKIGDFSFKSGTVKTNDGSVILLKNNGNIFNLSEKQQLSNDVCDVEYLIKDFNNFCLFKGVDGNYILLNKDTKKVLDCCGEVPWWGRSLQNGANFITSYNKKDQVRRLIDVKNANILLSGDIIPLYFDSNSLSFNKIIFKSEDEKYSIIDLDNDIDEKGNIIIRKAYSKLEKLGDGYKLSNNMFSSVLVDGQGNLVDKKGNKI
ncbi:MAG TPA: hypothetical protein P5155_02075 [Candidatus Absconditabacterales bacterium]|nr:hypothetical protein [Candidatus Absconditabacterales bacterium]